MKLKRSSIFMKIVILALLVYAAITLAGAKNRIASAQADQAALQEKVDAALQENAELEYDVAHAPDEAGAGHARRKDLLRRRKLIHKDQRYLCKWKWELSWRAE